MTPAEFKKFLQIFHITSGGGGGGSVVSVNSQAPDMSGNVYLDSDHIPQGIANIFATNDGGNTDNLASLPTILDLYFQLSGKLSIANHLSELFANSGGTNALSAQNLGVSNGYIQIRTTPEGFPPYTILDASNIGMLVYFDGSVTQVQMPDATTLAENIKGRLIQWYNYSSTIPIQIYNNSGSLIYTLAPSTIKYLTVATTETTDGLWEFIDLQTQEQFNQWMLSGIVSVGINNGYAYLITPAYPTDVVLTAIDIGKLLFTDGSISTITLPDATTLSSNIQGRLCCLHNYGALTTTPIDIYDNGGNLLFNLKPRSIMFLFCGGITTPNGAWQLLPPYLDGQVNNSIFAGLTSLDGSVIITQPGGSGNPVNLEAISTTPDSTNAFGYIDFNSNDGTSFPLSFGDQATYFVIPMGSGSLAYNRVTEVYNCQIIPVPSTSGLYGIKNVSGAAGWFEVIVNVTANFVNNTIVLPQTYFINLAKNILPGPSPTPYIIDENFRVPLIVQRISSQYSGVAVFEVYLENNDTIYACLRNGGPSNVQFDNQLYFNNVSVAMKSIGLSVNGTYNGSPLYANNVDIALSNPPTSKLQLTYTDTAHNVSLPPLDDTLFPPGGSFYIINSNSSTQNANLLLSDSTPVGPIPPNTLLQVFRENISDQPSGWSFSTLVSAFNGLSNQVSYLPTPQFVYVNPNYVQSRQNGTLEFPFADYTAAINYINGLGIPPSVGYQYTIFVTGDVVDSSDNIAFYPFVNVIGIGQASITTQNILCDGSFSTETNPSLSLTNISLIGTSSVLFYSNSGSQVNFVFNNVDFSNSSSVSIYNETNDTNVSATFVNCKCQNQFTTVNVLANGYGCSFAVYRCWSQSDNAHVINTLFGSPNCSLDIQSLANGSSRLNVYSSSNCALYLSDEGVNFHSAKCYVDDSSYPSSFSYGGASTLDDLGLLSDSAAVNVNYSPSNYTPDNNGGLIPTNGVEAHLRGIDSALAVLRANIMNYVEVTGTSQVIADNTDYVANSSSQVVFTLPGTMVAGKKFSIAYKGTGGWQLQLSGGQSVRFGNLTISGSISNSDVGDNVAFECITSNTLWEVTRTMGNLSYT